MKHNKKRNTAFIYESLVKEMTKAIIANDLLRKETVVSILKESCMSDSILGQELDLYQTLLETRGMPPRLAEKLLTEIKSARTRLDSADVFDAQSRVISKINKNLGSGVWANFIANYKSLASISAIFNPKTGVKQKVLFEQSLVDAMCTPKKDVATEMRPVDNLVYHSFIEKFNDKYHGLLQEQKDLLNRYITSFADEGFELKVYLNEELARLKLILKEAAATELQPLIQEKVSSVVEYLDSFRHREFEETDLQKILKTQELAQELSSHD